MGAARVYTGVAETRYLSVCLLRRARRNVHFDPRKLGDRPPTYGRAHGSLVPLTSTAPVAVTTYVRSCGLKVAGRRPARSSSVPLTTIAAVAVTTYAAVDVYRSPVARQ